MLDDLMGLFNGGGGLDPALGQLLAQNPEAIIPHLVSQGVAPPTVPPPMAGQGGGTPQDSGMSPLGALRGATAADADNGYSPSVPFTGPGGQVERAREYYGPMVQSMWDRLTSMPPNPLGGAAQAAPASPQPLAGATAADADQGYNPGAPPQVPMPASQQQVAAGSGPLTNPNAIPIPQPRPTGAPQGGQQTGDLMKAMQGVKAPEAPKIQHVSSPSVPRPNPIATNPAMLQLLMAASQGGAPQQNLLLSHALYGGGRRP